MLCSVSSRLVPYEWIFILLSHTCVCSELLEFQGDGLGYVCINWRPELSLHWKAGERCKSFRNHLLRAAFLAGCSSTIIIWNEAWEVTVAVHALPGFECSQPDCSWPECRGVCEALEPLVPSEGCLWLTARVSSRTLWLSSTKLHLSSCKPLCGGCQSRFSNFPAGIPCLSPGDLLNFPSFPCAPPPSGPLAGFCQLQAGSDLCSHLFPSVLAPPWVPQ